MRTSNVFFFLFVFGSSIVFSQDKKLTNELIHGSGPFTTRSPANVRWIQGGKSFSYQETDPETPAVRLRVHSVSSGRDEVILDTKALTSGDKPFSFSGYQWSPDEKSILFTTAPPARQYFSRAMPSGPLFLYDLAHKTLRKVTDGGERVYNQKFSPDGKLIGYVRENNIYVLDIASGRESRMTQDGALSVINGKFDWVYEEEFGIRDGWRWSGDGKQIAFWQLDEERVPQFNMINHGSLRSDLMPMKYPKAGDPNSVVRIGVVDLATNRTVWQDIGNSADQYIPRIQWMPGTGRLAITRLNRLQNRVELLSADITSGQTKPFFSETEKTWIDIHDDLTFLKRGDAFLWTSDRDGYSHIYLFGMDGNLKNQITRGAWEVINVVHVDEQGGRIFFMAGEKSIFERHLYVVGMDGKGFKRITPGNFSYSVNLSPDGNHFIGTFSTATTPPKTALFSTTGKLIRMLEENSSVPLSEYTFGSFEFFKFSTSDGVPLNGWMIKPPDFNPAKKYPVLMYVYGGPGSQTVVNAWGGSRYLWHQMLAQEGYIVVSVDNRGTGMRGKEFKSITYRNLGKWEVNDQIEAAKHLRTLPYIDGTRIGIWGWSYGGYMASLSLLVGTDVFKAAVAVAPVTDWKFYDTIYTERFMQRPEDNESGYRESAPITHAAKLKGKLLLVHGTTDDNVHWQNALQLADALQKAGKQFETLYYVNKNHGISGGNTRVHLHDRMTQFLNESLREH
ncbi:MAG: S9 family peptidase [Ignavibacteria bacterium]|nr:S9 family peptidase [Ignavibacteria bacterium]